MGALGVPGGGLGGGLGVPEGPGVGLRMLGVIWGFPGSLWGSLGESQRESGVPGAGLGGVQGSLSLPWGVPGVTWGSWGWFEDPEGSLASPGGHSGDPGGSLGSWGGSGVVLWVPGGVPGLLGNSQGSFGCWGGGCPSAGPRRYFRGPGGPSACPGAPGGSLRVLRGVWGEFRGPSVCLGGGGSRG